MVVAPLQIESGQCEICGIDLKEDEKGVCEFCFMWNWPGVDDDEA